MVRRGLEALIDRKSFYRLAEHRRRARRWTAWLAVRPLVGRGVFSADPRRRTQELRTTDGRDRMGAGRDGAGDSREEGVHRADLGQGQDQIRRATLRTVPEMSAHW